jgi:two-component system sensor histidine kinase SenX3
MAREMFSIKASNKELLDLVQTVLETYKLKGKTIRLYRENIMLKAFITEIIDEMYSIAKKSNNKLNFYAPRDIRVFADRMQLKRVIKNLIQNAISYGEANSPIDITIGEIPKYIVIKVKDYGAGISPSEIDKIFNKYYSAAKKFRKIGTGLGLYLACQIAKAHGGDLTVESIEGEFTEFTVKIPAGTNESLYYGE